MKTNKINFNMETICKFVNSESIAKIGMYQDLEKENKLQILENNAETMKQYVTSCGYNIEVAVMEDVTDNPDISLVYIAHYAYHMYKNLPALYNVVVGKNDSLEFDNLNEATCFMMYGIIPALYDFICSIEDSNPEILNNVSYLNDIDMNTNHGYIKFMNRLMNCRMKVGDKVATANEWADLDGYNISWILDICNGSKLEWLYKIENVANRMKEKS